MHRIRRTVATLLVPAAILAVGASLGAGPTRISGKITNVDVHRRTLTVADRDAKKDITVLVNGDSVIVLDGDDEAGLDDLFEGDRVDEAAVRDRGNGQLVLIKAIVTSRPDAGDDEQEKSGEDGVRR